MVSNCIIQNKYFRRIQILILISTQLPIAFSCGKKNINEEIPGLQRGSPDWIIHMYFVEKSFPSLKKYVSGGVSEDDSWGKHWDEGVKVTYRKLQADSNQVCYSIVAASDSNQLDIYGFIKRHPEGWKLDAMRSLVWQGLFKMFVDSLSNEANLADSTVFLLENAKLYITPDDGLKHHILDNLVAFEEIVEMFRQNQELRGVAANDYFRKDVFHTKNESEQKIIDLLVKLGVQTVSINDHAGQIEFMIGGITDDTVYYLYLPEGQSPPKMSSDLFIYVEEILPNWYIVKTT